LHTFEKRAVALGFPAALSISAAGDILARDVNSGHGRQRPKTSDAVFRGDGTVTRGLDLGYYDLFNNYLRLDGGNHVYFLSGMESFKSGKTNPASYSPWSRPSLWVGFVDPDSMEIGRLFDLDLPGRDDVCLQGGPGLVLRHKTSASAVLACEMFHRLPGANGRKYVVARRDLNSGKLHWSTGLAAQATSMASLKGGEFVAVALADGSIQVVRTRDGEIMGSQAVEVNRIPNMALSLVSRDNRLLAGTIDGRVIAYDLEF
jgi:hypothetical protein